MRRVAVLACLLALSAGCRAGSQAVPATLPPLSSTTPSPSPSVPVPSAQILPAPTGAAETRESATVFGRYWVDVLNDAYRRVDASTITAISDPGCQPCQNYVTSLSADHAAKYTYRGGVIVTRDAVAAPLEDGETVVSVLVSAGQLDVVDTSGTLKASVAAFPKATLQVEVRWTSAGWRVSDVTRT